MGWFTRRKTREQNLRRELEAHLFLEAEEQSQAGVPSHESRAAARRALGNLTSIQEATREVWGRGWLERLLQDLSFGLRNFGKTPMFTSVIVLTLALGIGATSAIFSIVNAVLLQPLPYKDADRLIVIWLHSQHDAQVKSFDTYRDFEIWKSRSHSFQQLSVATWATGGKIFNGHGRAENVLVMPVSLNFFNLLGVRPEHGYTFLKSDLDKGCTVVLRHSFWKETLGGDPNVMGRDIRLDEQSCTIVGIMPQGFTFYPDAVSMWRLLTPHDEIVRNAENSMVGVFGRLKPGISLTEAQREVRSIYAGIHRRDRPVNKLIPSVYPLQEEFTFLTGANLRLSLLVLLGAVSLVLLIACVNVANLLLGRSLVREKEFAVRYALGAGRMRLIRQLLTEGLLLAMCGALLGIGIAMGAVHVFRSLNPIQMPPGVAVSVNLPVLLFTLVLAVLTALLFSLGPAWKSSRIDLHQSLKANTRGVSRGIASRTSGKMLVVVEVMLSLVLLAGAGLLIRSVIQFAAVPLGFSVKHVSGIGIELPAGRYTKPGERASFYCKVLNDVQGLPGTDAVALTTYFPLWGGGASESFRIAGRTVSASDKPQSLHQAITPGYLSVMGTPLLQGRNFDEQDRFNSPPVVIVNQALARKYFGHQNPIGQHIKAGESTSETPWLTVVGVVADQKDFDFFHEMNWAESPMLFRPVAQEEPERLSLFIRGNGDSSQLQLAVQRRIRLIDSGVAVEKAEDLQDRFSKVLAYPRFRAILMGGFAGIALLLASVGLYGVLAQLVVQRTQEIGIRMALGAQKRDVLLLVVQQGMVLVGLGIAAGLLSAWFLIKLLHTLLYRPGASDISMLLEVSLVLLAAAFLAAYIPARKAAGVDPMMALRNE